MSFTSFLKTGHDWLWDTGLAFDWNFCFLFHIEATPLAYVDTPFSTFCTSRFLGMWTFFPLQWAVEGTWKETDRVGRSAWEVECVCAAHTATKIKLKDVNLICGLSAGTLVPDLLQRCYFDTGNVRCLGNREMIFKNRRVSDMCCKKWSTEGSRLEAGDILEQLSQFLTFIFETVIAVVP